MKVLSPERFPVLFAAVFSAFSLMWVLGFTVPVRVESVEGSLIDCGSPSGVGDGDLPAGLTDADRQACIGRASAISGLIMIPFGVLFVAALVSGWRYYSQASVMRGTSRDPTRSRADLHRVMRERVRARTLAHQLLASGIGVLVAGAGLLVVMKLGDYPEGWLLFFGSLGALITGLGVRTGVLYVINRDRR